MQAQDLTDEAADSVNKALELAEPENAVRLFLDKGPILPLLLKKAAKRNNQSVLLKRLLADGSNSSTPTKNSRQPEEPLSDRELDVLKLLSTELSGPEIARQLFVSLNTMRTHTKNIYSKLGVNSRRAAG